MRAKGDGDEFRDQLRDSNHAFADYLFGRCELSKRQDWCLEAAADAFAIIGEVLTYTDKTRQLDANILRDSVLQRLELMHFQAYIHVCGTMWAVAFEELRALTNSSGVELNPIELNEVYDKLWDLGDLIKGDTCLDIFKEDYRPWGKRAGLEAFYSKREVAGGIAEKKLTLLRAFESRTDKEKYVPILKKILNLFGEGIHESLERTMGDYLEATEGKMAKSKLEPWVKARVVQLLSHNNHAERPFAVIKLFDQLFQTMSLSNLSGLSNARCNGTFKRAAPPPKTKKTAAKATCKAGAAVEAVPLLRKAVSSVCGVRKRKGAGGRFIASGAVTQMARENRQKDGSDSEALRKRKREAKFEENRRKKTKKAQKKDAAHTVELVTTVAKLEEALSAKSGKGTRVTFLSKQVDARLEGRSFTYALQAVPLKYRSTFFKDKRIKKSTDGDEVAYLTELVKLMIQDDITEKRYGADALAGATATDITIARQLPMISDEYTCDFSKGLKLKEREEAAEMMEVDDDEYLVELSEKYIGELFYDDDANHKTYRVTDIHYDERGDKCYYEAAAVPVVRGEGGWEVPKGALVRGTETVKDAALVGYYLAEVSDPDNIESFDDIDEMIETFKEKEGGLVALAVGGI